MPHRQITSGDVASVPQPGYDLPESLQFSPDDNLVTYLRSSNQSYFRQLYAYDLRTDREFLYNQPEMNDEPTDDNLVQEEEYRRKVGVFYLCFEKKFLFFSSKEGNLLNDETDYFSIRNFLLSP